MSTALLTDQYELTMVQAALADGTAERKATFEVFARNLPDGFRYGVFAGTGRLLDLIKEFRFEGEVLTYLREQGIVNKQTYDYLHDFDFKGTITAYREGDLYFPNSPVLTVEGTFAECVVLETLVLSVLNADSAIATKAARMVSEATGRKIIEMGSRRTHEQAAVDVARAAYIAGFAATSNLMAGMKYGVPTTGTAAHAWTLAHSQEKDAFAAQVKSLGVGTALLVDTYDIAEGIRNAVDAATDEANVGGPGAIRIDSGDLYSEAVKARRLLDSLGARETKILVSGDMDEYTMKDLREAPIDGYGVGTKLVSTPPSGFVYKLVEIETPAYMNGESAGSYMRRVSKKSKNKVSVGGKKQAYRVYDENGEIEAEVFVTDEPQTFPERVRRLTDVVMEDGKIVVNFDLEDTRKFHAVAKAELPEGEQRVWVGTFDPFLTAEHAA